MDSKNWLEKIDSASAVAFGALASFLIAIFVVLAIVCIQFYIHESGHMLGCFVSGWLQGVSPQCGYTAWVKVPAIKGLVEIPAPQQTGTNLAPSFLFAIMGPAWTVFSFAAIAILAWHYLKVDWKICLVVFCFIALQETLINTACGTDNLSGKPYLFCEGNAMVAFIENWIYVIMAFPIAYSLYPRISRWWEKVLEKRRGYAMRVMKR